VYPWPPPYYPPAPYPAGPPGPHRPGLTTAAVVLMWVLFGLGLLGGLVSTLVLVFDREMFSEVFPGLADRIPLVLLVTLVQTALFAALRGLFAVRIARRSASARTGALVVEGVSIGYQLIAQVVLFSAMLPVDPGRSVSVRFDCTGVVLSILVLCFLGSARSARWCDR
jgi:hypothetical protein